MSTWKWFAIPLAAAVAVLSACSAPQPAGGNGGSTPSLRWHLQPGMSLEIQGQQQASLTSSAQGSPPQVLGSTITVILDLLVQQIDKAGNAQVRVFVKQVSGTNANGISIDGGQVAPYQVTVAPSGQIVGGRLWPALGSAGMVPAIDAFSAVTRNGTIPVQGSWTTDAGRAYPQAGGQMEAQAESAVTGRSPTDGITVSTTIDYPLSYDDATMQSHNTGTVKNTITSTFFAVGGAVKTTEDSATFAIDYTINRIGTRGHMEGSAQTTFQFA